MKLGLDVFELLKLKSVAFNAWKMSGDMVVWVLSKTVYEMDMASGEIVYLRSYF